MKKARKFITLLIVAVLGFHLNSCSDGSPDELKGIYGLSTIYFCDFENNYTYFGGYFDYMVLEVYDDSTLTVIYKVENENEKTLNTTYTMNYNDDQSVVYSIQVAEFPLVASSSRTENKLVWNDTDENGESDGTGIKKDVKLSFGALTNNLAYENSYTKYENGSFHTKTFKQQYKKLYKKINDYYLKKAIESQTKEKENRTGSSD